MKITGQRGAPVLLFLMATICSAQTSAFTYQGRLANSGAAANGTYDFQFRIFNASANGTLLGALNIGSVPVTNGLFTVTLNYGDVIFSGAQRWLEISVATNFSGAYTTLSPRQEITAAPYATRAAIASTVPAGSITGAMLVPGSITATQLAFGSITADRLASDSIGASQLSKRYLGGSVSYGSFGAPFNTIFTERQVNFTVPFRVPPIITLTLDTPHPALPMKGSPLILSRSTNSFRMRVASAAVGVEIAKGGSQTTRPSIAVVNGTPAAIGTGTIGFSTGLIYNRSLDFSGSDWPDPIMIQPGYSTATDLLVADGHPAVFCTDNSGGITFFRASDSNGTNWPAGMQIVNPTEHPGIIRLAGAMINGNPALLFNSQNDVFYVRATDSQGTGWSSAVKVYSGATFINSIDLASIAGVPACAILSGQVIRYARALDAAGSSWPAPIVAVPDTSPDPTMGPHENVTLLESPGSFAPVMIGFADMQSATENQKRMMYSVATDGVGATWSAAQSITASGTYSGLAFANVNNRPAAATISGGSVSYIGNSPFSFTGLMPLEPAVFDCYLCDVNGEPAIAFYDSNSLRFIRRNTPPPNSAINWIAVEP